MELRRSSERRCSAAGMTSCSSRATSAPTARSPPTSRHRCSRPTSQRRRPTSRTRSCSAQAATPDTTSSTRDAIEGVTVKLDWAQAFAQKRATLIAGTGYQYGDTDFIEYSERLYHEFRTAVARGEHGTVDLGRRGARAVQRSDYLAVTPDVRGIHQKALLEATVFGLPMLSVNMPGTRSGIPSGSGVITPTLVPSGPANTLGLHTASLPLTPIPTPPPPIPLSQSICMKNAPFDAPNPPTAPVPPTCSVPSGYGSYRAVSWLNGTDGVVSNPAEPVLPLHVANVTPTTAVALRGVGLESASYTDSILTPLTGAPTTEIRGVHTSFSSPVLFPMRLWTSNYFGALSSTVGTRLLVTPAQHRAADLTAGTSVRRQFNGLTLNLYYSANTTAAALSAAPTIVSTNATPSGGGIKFAAQVVGDPAAAIHDVWVTYTADGGPSGTWTSVHLTQCGTPAPTVCESTTDTQQWMGQLGSPPVSGKYIVQAVNGVGLVSLDDNLGAYYSFAATPPTAAAATALAFASPPISITYGETPLVTAVLSVGATGISGAPLTFSVAGTAATTTTGAGGIGERQPRQGRTGLVHPRRELRRQLELSAFERIELPSPSTWRRRASWTILLRSPGGIPAGAQGGVPQLQNPSLRSWSHSPYRRATRTEDIHGLHRHDRSRRVTTYGASDRHV